MPAHSVGEPTTRLADYARPLDHRRRHQLPGPHLVKSRPGPSTRDRPSFTGGGEPWEVHPGHLIFESTTGTRHRVHAGEAPPSIHHYAEGFLKQGPWPIRRERVSERRRRRRRLGEKWAYRCIHGPSHGKDKRIHGCSGDGGAAIRVHATRYERFDGPFSYRAWPSSLAKLAFEQRCRATLDFGRRAECLLPTNCQSARGRAVRTSAARGRQQAGRQARTQPKKNRPLPPSGSSTPSSSALRCRNNSVSGTAAAVFILDLGSRLHLASVEYKSASRSSSLGSEAGQRSSTCLTVSSRFARGSTCLRSSSRSSSLGSEAAEKIVYPERGSRI
ncbi:hypothetical protein MPTK1_3g07300 [Marchantia polymorpha subsp. ruderalis]|uniref:Uncharacterized protein n=2 Tax=Marchantia polymorpha TaxID=3197 RepID=A0AAF6AYB1_MARPO|nr:hypothetical protein MARPO_0006s0204 [Marchantia polymorpha]BBN04745.1 hypothetical protein Mp_3g07300 [Marchantia polymorpha subsp. ruderalis]|eukprot:PTQ48190.1 hypothetical protein MARPO_0006s0204 [Marchantia polymorpha]